MVLAEINSEMEELAQQLPGLDTSDPKDKIWPYLIAEHDVNLEALRTITPDEIRRFMKACSPADQAPAPRIPEPPIAIQESRVLVNGQFVPLNLTTERLFDALHFLRQLIASCGQWVTGPDISKACPERYDNRFRWDRVQQALPPAITQHIETDRRKGKRLKSLR
jgi:hypothetical protein